MQLTNRWKKWSNYAFPPIISPHFKIKQVDYIIKLIACLSRCTNQVNYHYHDFPSVYKHPSPINVHSQNNKQISIRSKDKRSALFIWYVRCFHACSGEMIARVLQIHNRPNKLRKPAPTNIMPSSGYKEKIPQYKIGQEYCAVFG
jgi:hypothetical protein